MAEVAFYLIKLAARWDLVITTGLATWCIIYPALHESCGGMIHYTSYRHNVQGLNTIIPNLLKVSEHWLSG